MKANVSVKPDFLEEKKNGKFNLKILGKKDDNKNLFSETFPILIKKFRHKYLSRFDLCLKEEIVFSKDFLNIFNPKIIDKLLDVDILILTFTGSNNTSLEFLKRFYYLYYNKLEENDKPKNIILIEFDHNSNDSNKEGITPEAPAKIDRNSIDNLQKLFNAYFYSDNEKEEKLNGILKECVINLNRIYNLEEDYGSFKYIDLDKEINSLILIYGDMEIQKNFMLLLLESNSDNSHKKIKENIYELKYERIINDKKYKFKLTLKLMKNE